MTHLTDPDLPAVFRGADKASKSGQRKTVLLTAGYLSALVVAAFGGLTSFHLGHSDVNVTGLLAVGAFALSLVISLAIQAKHPEKQWYQGRAGAESVKTLAWRYAVGGDPFELGTDADALLVSRLSQTLKNLRDIEWTSIDDGAQITGAMRQMRAGSLEERKSSYMDGRIVDQINWYTRSGRKSEERARQFNRLANICVILGIIAGITRGFGLIDVDWLGLLAAGAAAFTAWLEMRQHRVLSTSYAVAVQELGLVQERVGSIDTEADWARFVSDAEDAISREHTLWLARRSVVGG